MIVYPKDWGKIGQPIELKEIEDTILRILAEIKCDCLALSGGLDSSLMLYFMLKIYPRVEVFTIGKSEKHPDIRYSKLMVRSLENYDRLIKHRIYISTQKEIDEEEDKGFRGDRAVRLFYKFVNNYTDSIIECDGIDEFMCGYPDHQVPQTELVYFAYIRRLQLEQLEPLNKNSNGVKVYLPYLNKELLYLLCQIPLVEKVNKVERKIPMIEMAKGKLPDEVINRCKMGFCNALKTKESSDL